MKKFKLLFFVLLSFAALALTACGDNEENGNDNEASVTDEYIADVNCSNGWERYEVTETPIKFCHDPAWGEVMEGEADAVSGKVKTITFSERLNDLKIWYVSQDAQLPEGVKDVCYTCFDIVGNEEMVLKGAAEAFAVSESELTARKTDIGGHRGVRVRAQNQNNIYGQGETLGIYVPRAFDGYNLAVVGKASLAEEVDNLSFDMAL